MWEGVGWLDTRQVCETERERVLTSARHVISKLYDLMMTVKVVKFLDRSLRAPANIYLDC